jgi:hypothetical protein
VDPFSSFVAEEDFFCHAIHKQQFLKRMEGSIPAAISTAAVRGILGPEYARHFIILVDPVLHPMGDGIDLISCQSEPWLPE